MARIPELTLGRRIYLARIDAGFSQADIADVCVVSRPLVSRWETGASDPRLKHVLAIADATGISPAWLAGTQAADPGNASFLAEPSPQLPFLTAA